MKKSALSAALAGGPAPAVPAPPTAPASKTSTTLDPVAFPCIEYAGVIDGTITEDQLVALEGQLHNLDVTDVSIVGSAPTNVLLDGVPLVSSNTGMLMIDVEPPARLHAETPVLRRHSCRPITRSTRGGEGLEKRRRQMSLPRWYVCNNPTWWLSPRLHPAITCPVCQTSQGTSGSVPPPVGSLSSNYLSKAVIGSLPKGLTQEDKMRILQALPMSPSRALLQELGAVGNLKSSQLGSSWQRSRSSSNWGQQHEHGCALSHPGAPSTVLPKPSQTPTALVTLPPPPQTANTMRATVVPLANMSLGDLGHKG